MAMHFICFSDGKSLYCIASHQHIDFSFLYYHFGWTVNVGHPVDVSAKTAQLYIHRLHWIWTIDHSTQWPTFTHIQKIKRRIHCANGTRIFLLFFFFVLNRKDKMRKWRIFCTSANSFDSIRLNSIRSKSIYLNIKGYSSWKLLFHWFKNTRAIHWPIQFNSFQCYITRVKVLKTLFPTFGFGLYIFTPDILSTARRTLIWYTRARELHRNEHKTIL